VVINLIGCFKIIIINISDVLYDAGPNLLEGNCVVGALLDEGVEQEHANGR
jgi:hypothetical protein